MFSKTDNDNNAVVGVKGVDNVIINNLEINGTDGVDLHGINVYLSSNVALNDVTSRNNRSGVVVNGSEVTVNNITTKGNIWHGINVDNGGGVTEPSVLRLTV